MALDYSIELDDGDAIYQEATTRATARVEDDGLEPLPARPMKRDGKFFDGRLPANVSSLPTKELAEVYSYMCHYADFVTSRLTRARTMTTNSKERLELATAKIRKSKSGTVADKNDDVTCDSRYVDINAQWLEARTYQDILTGIDAAAQRDLKFISRLIEARKIEVTQGGRSANLDRKPSPAAFRRE